jgi:hypothetical protein
VAGVPARISIGRSISTLTVLGGKTANGRNRGVAADAAAPEPQAAGASVSREHVV